MMNEETRDAIVAHCLDFDRETVEELYEQAIVFIDAIEKLI